MKNGELNLRSTDRKFGYVMIVGFSLLSLLMWYKSFVIPQYLFMAVVGFFGLVTPFFPSYLKPLEKYWMIFGEKMSFVVTTLIVSCVFILVICPIGVLRRLFGVDKLKLKNDNRVTMWEVVESTPNLEKPY